MTDLAIRGPRAIDLSGSRGALWAIERNDRRGFVTWNEMESGKPITFLLLWTKARFAERYAYEELKDTGRPYRIKREVVLPFLRKMLATKIKWVWFNRLPIEAAEKETGVHGFASIQNLITYLSGGGRIAGERRA